MWFTLACDTGSTASQGSGDTESQCMDFEASSDVDGNIVVLARDILNYHFSSKLTVNTVSVRAGADIIFDWSGATRHLLEREFDPLTGVDSMQISLCRYTPDELIQAIAADAVDNARRIVYAQVPTENNVSKMNFFLLQSAGGIPHEEDELLCYVDAEKYSVDEYITRIKPRQTSSLILFTWNQLPTSCTVHSSLLDRKSISVNSRMRTGSHLQALMKTAHGLSL